MKRLSFLCVLAVVLSCRSGVQNSELQLSAGNWDPVVRSNLNSLIAAQMDRGAYAVFDFDKTSIVHDVSQALWVYQVEHLRFADAPGHGFLDGVPDDAQKIGGVSFADMGAVLRDEFTQLSALRDAGKTLEQIHLTDVYKDFRARMATLLLGMDDVFGSEVSLLWMPGLLAGYTEAEAREQGNKGRYMLQPNFASIRGRIDGGGI